MSLHLLERSKAIQWESTVVLVLGAILISAFTINDINFHGHYVGKLIELCYPENQSHECTEFRKHLGVSMTAHTELGNQYWQDQQWQVWFVGIMMFWFRMSIAIILHKKTVYKIKSFTIIMAVIYGIIGSTLFLFGVLDSLYYVYQKENIPDTLSWLDGTGVFQETKKFFGDPTHVEFEDLIATNIIGILLILGFIFVGMLTMAVSKSERAIA